jgi:hypothetical protein
MGVEEDWIPAFAGMTMGVGEDWIPGQARNDNKWGTERQKIGME